MSEPEIDIAALVEAGARAYQLTDPDYDNSTTVARAILTAVLPLVLAGPRDTLEWYANPKNWANVIPDPQERITTRVSFMGMDVHSLKGEGIGRAIVQSVMPARSTLTRIEALLKDESRGTEDG